MKEELLKYIRNKKTRILTLSEIYDILCLPYNPENDKIIYNIIKVVEEEKYIEPLKTARRNYQGCFEKYRILNQNEGNEEKIKKEILKLNKKLQIDYYLKHPEEYEKNKEVILPINEFFEKLESDCSNVVLSVNERSYKIYKNEKMLKLNENILKKLGITYDDLYAFETYEPFFYYINEFFKNKTKTILIIENKDTFWTIVKTIQNLKIKNLYMTIYGEGEKILKSFSFVKELNISTKDEIQYFGDIDFEGINIYENLKERYNEYNISAYKIGYETILELENNPQNIRKKQNISENKINQFLQEFSDDYRNKLKNIFENKKFIPQEVFNLEVANKNMCKSDNVMRN